MPYSELKNGASENIALFLQRPNYIGGGGVLTGGRAKLIFSLYIQHFFYYLIENLQFIQI